MGFGSTLFLTSCLPSKAMATVVAVETAGGAGKDGAPHREPSPRQRCGPSLKLFLERPPWEQTCPPRPGCWRTESLGEWRASESGGTPIPA